MQIMLGVGYATYALAGLDAVILVYSAFFVMWPLTLSFNAIVQLNTFLADVPARLVRRRVHRYIFWWRRAGTGR